MSTGANAQTSATDATLKVSAPQSDDPSLTTTSTPKNAPPSSTSAEKTAAAQTIQRNYRGYRSRRQVQGLSLDPSTRWVDLVKEVKYRELTRPRARRLFSNDSTVSGSVTSPASPGTNFAQSEWKRLKQIADRAHNDDTSEDDSGEEGLTGDQLAAYRKKRKEDKRRREQNAQDMGLSYWLEMVDSKHRYGSHLRSYHAIWKQSPTNDNFFYWLDEGEGRNIDAPGCSREVLDRDQVRYLSREERLNYLVKIDKQGHLRWAKNNELINTNYNFKDSLKGIVSAKDTTPAYREDTRYPNKHPPPGAPDAVDKSTPSDPSAAGATTAAISSSSSGEDSDADGAHYVNADLKNAKGVKKVQYVSAATVLNHLLQTTTKKNTWIFVADTSFRLYIGIKQSGAFQHSSFLHGARISAAGLIKVKNGQLRSLSPLSGHYRPPTSAFRAFVHSLREKGVDMSRVSISKSYAVLLGLEGYLKTKQRAKTGVGELERHFEKVIDPEKARKRAESELDKSESAKRERDYMEKQKADAKNRGLRKSLTDKMEKLKLYRSGTAGSTTSTGTSSMGNVATQTNPGSLETTPVKSPKGDENPA